MGGHTSEKSRTEFKSGLCRRAENAEQENGIWQVIMSVFSASQTDKANAIAKLTEFQALTRNYKELKTRVGGGRFTDESARAGSKRVRMVSPNDRLTTSGNTSVPLWNLLQYRFVCTYYGLWDEEGYSKLDKTL